MDVNTAERESAPTGDDEENQERPPRRKRGTGASTIARLFMALLGGGVGYGGYVMVKKLRASQAEVAATHDALHTAQARSVAADGRTAELSRQLDQARAHAHDVETQLATSEGHAQDLEGQLDQARTTFNSERQQLGEQLSQANARAGEVDALAARFHDLMARSGGETHTAANGQVSLQLVDRVLFAAGDAELTPEGQAVLAQVAEILRSVPDKQIWIEGHTDVAPVPHPDRFATNWELSTARALSVVHYLQDQQHIDPRRLAVVGFGQFRPVTHRPGARNRRIEIVLLPRDLRVQS